ncbi:thiamine-phosphate kinase [Brachybacterium hainanense]|uniref:Thiamine-monophosphate kinase n=1 Tax=Brachybacterium hainanense TaxID=1541174 RepID=A0ABV6RAE9_9MICO
MPSIAHLHESGLLAAILPHFAAGPEVELGPGDDAAVVRLPSSRLVITTDALVEGADFLLPATSPESIGAKAAVQNLADVAAMGARPIAVVVALSAPPSTQLAVLEGISRGLADRCAEHGVSVVGGDLGRADQLSIAVTAVGALGEDEEPITRGGARPGDVLAIGAPLLGRSAAGLAQLLAGDLSGEHVAWHNAPAPDLSLGWGAGRGAHAMMDLSDGLVRDGGRLAAASGVRIDLSRALLAADATALAPAAHALAADPWDYVLHSAEEHAMLAAFGPGGVPEGFRPIGRVEERRPEDGDGVLLLDGATISGQGWEHFV